MSAEQVKKLAEWLNSEYIVWTLGQPFLCAEDMLEAYRAWNPFNLIQDAWMLVGRLHELGWCIDLSDMTKAEENPGWWYELDRYEPIFDENAPAELYGKAWCATHYYKLDGGADTAPAAICQAVLKLMEDTEG